MSLRLTHDPLGRLVLDLDGGARHVGVTPVRCFPFTAPGEQVAFCDEQGREVHHLLTLDELPAAERALLERELAAREFLPIIHRIVAISDGADPTLWHVETNRGAVQFSLPSEDNIRRLGPHGALIADSFGVRYRIPDLRHLDKASRALLNRFL